MGSNLCVRCGTTLIPHSYCDVCHDLLCFTCPSCSMITDERIHAHCRKASTNNSIHQEIHKSLVEPNSPQIIMNNNYFTTHYYFQNQLNDQLKYSSIKLLTSYWSNIFESIKLINNLWSKIFNIGNNNSSIADVKMNS